MPPDRLLAPLTVSDVSDVCDAGVAFSKADFDPVSETLVPVVQLRHIFERLPPPPLVVSLLKIDAQVNDRPLCTMDGTVALLCMARKEGSACCVWRARSAICCVSHTSWQGYELRVLAGAGNLSRVVQVCRRSSSQLPCDEWDNSTVTLLFR